jgi:hypothetical protein
MAAAILPRVAGQIPKAVEHLGVQPGAVFLQDLLCSLWSVSVSCSHKHTEGPSSPSTLSPRRQWGNWLAEATGLPLHYL